MAPALPVGISFKQLPNLPAIIHQRMNHRSRSPNRQVPLRPQTSGQCLIGLAVSQGSPAGPPRTEKRCKGGGRAGRPSLNTPATNWPSVSIRAHLTVLIQPPAYHIRTHPCRRLSRVCGQGRRALWTWGLDYTPHRLRGQGPLSTRDTSSSPSDFVSWLRTNPVSNNPYPGGGCSCVSCVVCRVSRETLPACSPSKPLASSNPPILRHLSHSPDTEEARRRSCALGETITSHHNIR